VKQEWRCTGCEKLLGIVTGGRLHIRFARGHQYVVGFPATSVCRTCHTVNELTNERHKATHIGDDIRK
jgi:phage FluMu protein Com